MREISAQGLDLIKKWEGFSAQAYRCPAGKWTIGFGHVMGPSEPHQPMDAAQAEALLRADLKPAQAAIASLALPDLTQSQYDALCCLIYNIGAGAFARSQLRRLLQATPWSMEALETQWLRWCYAGGRKLAGLEARRRAEWGVFTSTA